MYHRIITDDNDNYGGVSAMKIHNSRTYAFHPKELDRLNELHIAFNRVQEAPLWTEEWDEANDNAWNLYEDTYSFFQSLLQSMATIGMFTEAEDGIRI